MVARGTPTPNLLKSDAILEAVCEIRFEQRGLPEIFFGRMLDQPSWHGYSARASQFAQLPPALFEVSPEMRFQPRLEATSPDSLSQLKLGHRSASFHRRAPYPGWRVFHEDLFKMVRSLFAVTSDLKIVRMGLRYINGLQRELHGIQSIADLDIAASIGGEPLSSEANLNFTTRLAPDLLSTVRIASRGFLSGEFPADTSLVVDIDMFSGEEPGLRTSAEVEDWIQRAHAKEKDEFFHLFTAPTIARWRKD